MKNEQINEICETRINELYMEAFTTIKKTFEDPAALIKWASLATEDLYSFSKNFKFIGSENDLDIDEVFLFYYFHTLSIAWFKDNATGVKDALRELLHLGGAESFYHSILKALAVTSWNKTSGGIDSIKEFTEHFVCLVNVAFIFNQIEEIEEEVYEAKKQREQTV